MLYIWVLVRWVSTSIKYYSFFTIHYSLLTPNPMPKLLSLLILFFLSQAVVAQNTFTFGTNVNPQGTTFEVDSKGFVVGGKHVLPVMGEIHYARVPAKDWRREIRKMKAGGITIVATYVFWIHHESEEGHWNWAGNMNLREFLEVCKSENMPVVLRIGPFCHGWRFA